MREKMKKHKKIIFTVPHGCLTSLKDCDKNADLIATKTASILASECEACSEISVHINQTPREVVDMNRPEARGTPFRELIDAEVEDFDVLIFDTHTFPSSVFGWWNTDIGVFNLPKKRDDELAEFLVQEFKKSKFRVKKFSGASKNDIVQTVNDLGDDAILVEFSRDLDIDEAAQLFAEVIKKVVEYPEVLH